MQASHLVRAVAASLSIAIVALTLMGAGVSAKPLATAIVGVATGQYVNGVEVQRLPSITVTARRGDVAPE